ncbi:DUF4347 domain-containing protein [Bdellovibrio sp. HCB2-146]|uniref:DUF4347 domain-containing protein n=1 Tax=Bdellovibrio sp. HCB2-146 TaxID=3394362 RepID=UPI0039BD1E21
MRNKLLLTLLLTFPISYSFAQENTPMGMMISNGIQFPMPAKKYPLPVNAHYCREQEKRCADQKMEEADICLIGPNTLDGVSTKMSVYRWCGYNSDKYPIQSQEDLRKVFDSLLKKCVKIKDLRIFAHGAPGIAQVIENSNLDLNTTREQFASYSCLMAPNANIALMSCNTGRGCRGEDFMANFAQTMLPKGGTFTANTNYALYGSIFAITSPIVINLTQKQVTYKPNSWPRFEWNYLGQVSGIKDSFKQDTKTCVDELKKAIDQFKESSKDAEDQNCAGMFKSKLRDAEVLLAKLSKPQIEDYRNSKKYFKKDAPQYAEVLDSLENTARFLYQGHCDKQDTPTPGNTPSEWKNGVFE